MRIVSAILFALCCYMISQAQSLKVIVRDPDGGVPYAYLSVNGRTVAHTDSLGVGWLAVDRLSKGDTISAYYVGAPPVRVSYTELMKKNGLCELVFLDPLFRVAMGTVVVEGSAEKLFAKSLKDSYLIGVNGMLDANFEATILVADSSKRIIRGTLQAENLIRGKGLKKYCQYGYFHILHTIKTSDDTTGLGQKIRTIAGHALRSFGDEYLSGSSRVMCNKLFYNKYGYIGTKDGIRKFRITYRPKNNDRIVLQDLLYVSEQDRSLLRTEVSLLTPDSLGTRASAIVDYTYFMQKGNQERLIQKNIDYTVESKEGVDNIRITNIRFKAQ